MVNVDTVYQRVLAIANKEQRGYITPLEFNLYANQAQMDIFEQYFYDLNQFARMPSVGIEYSDVDEKIDEKLSVFKTVVSVGATAGIGTAGNSSFRSFNFPNSISNILPPDLYKIGTIWNQANATEIHKVDHRELTYIVNSPLTLPTSVRPIYVLDDDQISVFPSSVADVLFRYIRIPARVEWGYTIVDEQAQYNATSPSTQHFELHPSDEVDLVIKILEYAGVTMKNPTLYQLAGAEEQKIIQQEKQ